MVTVSSTSSTFLARARHLSGVRLAAREGVVGRAPDAGRVKDRVLKEHQASGGSSARSAHPTKTKKKSSDPLDSLLWGMDMINAPQAHRVDSGDKRVRVGVMDTGVDASHPDLAANFDSRLSRNFTTDMPDIDGPCEYASCVDPANVDDNGHGTHVAGTMAAALNGMGVSGVAPNVGIVNVRAGQDSGYFFLGATANALTYSGDVGIDVVNMSFYVDPWLYNCRGGAPRTPRSRPLSRTSSSRPCTGRSTTRTARGSPSWQPWATTTRTSRTRGPTSRAPTSPVARSTPARSTTRPAGPPGRGSARHRCLGARALATQVGLLQRVSPQVGRARGLRPGWLVP